MREASIKNGFEIFMGLPYGLNATHRAVSEDIGPGKAVLNLFFIVRLRMMRV